MQGCLFTGCGLLGSHNGVICSGSIGIVSKGYEAYKELLSMARLTYNPREYEEPKGGDICRL